MTTAIIGLIGVLVGSLSTAFVNHYLQKQAEERRWKREDRVRLREDRLTLYRDYYREIEKAKDLGLGSFNEDKLRLMIAEIELIGSSEVST